MGQRALVVVLAASLGLAACRVDVQVDARVHADGSGTVRVRATLDADAVQAAEAGGGKLEERVRLGDLATAGWKVSSWTRAADGSARVTLEKRFSRARDLPAVLREASGSSGILRDVAASRSRRLLLWTRSRVRATVDLGAVSTGLLSDPELVARLQISGVDPKAIDARLRAQLADALHVRVSVGLPGGEHAAVAPRAGERVGLRASASVLDTTLVAWFVGALVLIVGALVLLVAGEWRARTTRRRGSSAAAR